MAYSQHGCAPSSQPHEPSSQPYAPSAPSAPELPESYGKQQGEDRYSYANPYSGSGQSGQFGQHGDVDRYSSGYPYYGSGQPGQFGQQYGGVSKFPPGTHPDAIRSFELVDRDRSGFIDENELLQSLSVSGFERFGIRTIRLLMFLFKNPSDSLLRLGPKEFSELWSCLGQWRAIFDGFDRDRSGKIDLAELRDALHHLGYALPPSVLQLIVSKYDDHTGRKIELSFNNFVECGMVVKGLTEKFKEKDQRYTGSATLSYDTFLSMVIPFLVSYD